MKALFPFLKPYKKLLFIGPLFKLFEAILELLLPYLMSRIIDIGVMNSDKNYIIKVGVLMLGIAIVGIGCALVCQYSASIVSQGSGTRMRNALYEKIITFSNVELDQYGTPTLVNRITNDVNQVQLAVAMLIRLVIRAPFLCVGGLVMIFIIDVPLSIIMIIALPIFVFILSFIMKKSVPLYGKVQQKLDQITLILRENLSGVRVIRAFARENHEKARFALENDQYAKSTIQVGKISALLNPLTNLVMNGAVIAALWFGGIRVDSGSMSTGEVIAMISYFTQILAALIIISNLVVIFTKAYASSQRIIEVLETEPSIDSQETDSVIDTLQNKDKSYSNVDKQNGYAVEFMNVSMHYHGSSEAAIEKVSFAVKQGETVGIIGGTGSGKSTLLNLIPRFYDVSEGQVLVFGKDVRTYSLEELRKLIGIVPQKSILFSGTIAENIRMSKEDATLEEVEQACEKAMATEFILKYEDKYDTKIRRGGVNVSGGQRQRLSIARALVRNPKLLLMDDSFSALDYLTDKKIRMALKEKGEDQTTFIVSQRASTIQGADQIIVLDDGEIAGIGEHHFLYETCSIYREICESQNQEDEVRA